MNSKKQILSEGRNLKLHPAKWWRPLDGNKVQCTLCPRGCRPGPGEQGYCHSRINVDGEMFLTSWHKCSGVHIDPIEKKPLYHFQPGSKSFSVGTVGCNLGCLFCQNYQISRVGPDEIPMQEASPGSIVSTALQTGCSSIALTYNEPIVFAEYAIEIIRLAKARNLSVVAVTNGYINPEPRGELFKNIDAANVDLKAFTDSFYKRLCGAKLAPVLDTIAYLAAKKDTFLEITTLIIPGENDGEEELTMAADWIIEYCGENTPWHLSAFFPAWKMLNKQPTQPAMLKRARKIAMSRGLKFVYTGNVYDPDGATTFCSECGESLIVRDGFAVSENRITGGKCPSCGINLKKYFR